MNFERTIESRFYEDTDRVVIHQSTDDKFVEKALSTAAVAVQTNMVRKIKCEACLNELITQPYQHHAHKDITIVCKAAEPEFKIITNSKTNFNMEKYYDVLMSLFCLKFVTRLPVFLLAYKLIFWTNQQEKTTET